MPARFDILRPLEGDTASTLFLVRDEKLGGEAYLRRFKTQKPEEIDGLKELFNQLSKVSSIHLDAVVEFGADDESFYTLTAEPPPGRTLSEVLQGGPLSVEEFEAVALQVLDVLDVLHEQAIVHGSLRPDYIRITGVSAANWRVTLHGFGQGFAPRDETKEEQIRAYRCTAPEQWQDGTTRRRTDVYALGCVLYEALAARPPFDGRVLKELRNKHIGHDLTPLQKLSSHVPAWMCAWVMHLLAVDPEQRPRKAAAARDLFERREAPTLPELPPSSEAATVTNTPPVSLAAHLVSAPIVLPTAQPAAMHATSSTIPIAVGPHVGSAHASRRPTPAPVLRKPYAAPKKPPVYVVPSSTMPRWIAGAVGLLLLLLVFSRCGSNAAPVQPRSASQQR